MVALFPLSILARTGDNSKLLDLVCKRLLGRVLPQVHMVKVDTIQPIASVVIAKSSCNLLSISRIVQSSPVSQILCCSIPLKFLWIADDVNSSRK